MRSHHFNVFVLGAIISLAFGASLHLAEDLSISYGQAINARLQANLLAIAAATDTKQKEIETQKPVTMLFVGDVMLDRNVAAAVKGVGGGDWSFPFAGAVETINAADIAIGNLEGPISGRGEQQGSEYSFRFEPETAEAIGEAGFDVMSLANNHIWDYGAGALSDTLTFLASAGVQGVGAGQTEDEANKPEIILVKGERIAFLAYTPLYPEGLVARGENAGVSDFNIDKIEDEIIELKESGRADVVVVLMHWGEEYQKKANIWQKEEAAQLVEAGADLIVGTHPHVAQEVEQVKAGEKTGWVAYSLGNFVFDQKFSKETMRGLALKVTVRNKKIEKVERLLVIINENFQPSFGESLLVY